MNIFSQSVNCAKRASLRHGFLALWIALVLTGSSLTSPNQFQNDVAVNNSAVGKTCAISRAALVDSVTKPQLISEASAVWGSNTVWPKIAVKESV